MRILEKIASYFNNNVDFRLERYLSGAVDIHDLERRQKQWFHMSDSEKTYWGSK